MKKVFFIVTSLFFSLSVLSQEKLNTDDLIGYWSPSEKATQLFFWKDNEGILQVQEISSNSGKPIELIDFVIYENSICIKTIFLPNNWTTENTFTFIDKMNIKCIITGDGNGVIYYKKTK